jgi:hypothetical protein
MTMTDEQLIARISSMTDLTKVDAEREAYRFTRDRWIQEVRANRNISGELTNLSKLGFPGDFAEELNNLASEEQRANIERIDRFIAALDEQAEKLKGMGR